MVVGGRGQTDGGNDVGKEEEIQERWKEGR